MAKEKEDSKELSSNQILGGILKNNKADHFNYIEPKHKVISTGSLLLDSLVKVRSGTVVRLVGSGAELGKTSECFVLAQNYMDVMPKSKCIFIKAESRLSEEMKARSGHRFTTNPEEWDYGMVFEFRCNLFETVAKTLETLIPAMYERGEYLVVIIDALDGLILKSDYEKDIFGNSAENVRVAGVPLLTKLLFRRLGNKIVHYDVLCLITGQYSANIKLDPYSKEPPRQVESSGGSAIGHQADYVWSYSPRYQGDLILENPKEKPDRLKNKTLGVYASLEIKKSGTDVTGTKLRIPIARNRVGNQIWREKEVIDVAVSFEVLSRPDGKGAWYKFSQELIDEAAKAGLELQEAHQGLNGAYKYMEDNKEIFEWMYKKFQEVIS